MLGAIIGDIIGSRFEFRNHLSKEFELFSPDCRFTDDTVLTCAVAQALMDCAPDRGDLEDRTVEAMRRIGTKYPGCGYGARFHGWLFSADPHPYYSCGNGAAMRVSAAGFTAGNVEDAMTLSRAVTCVTHDHPEGLRGAEATAVAIVMAREGRAREEIMARMSEYYPDIETVDWYREHSAGHGREICQVSVPQALACFAEGTDYEDVIRSCISIGGDSDTIAAIAGGIAEAYFGIPETIRRTGLSYLDDRLHGIVDAFCRSLTETPSGG